MIMSVKAFNVTGIIVDWSIFVMKRSPQFEKDLPSLKKISPVWLG